MDVPAARGAPTRARLLAHSAPGVLAWACLLWIFAVDSLGWDNQWPIIVRLCNVQLGVVVLALLGGIGAFWLPSRRLRIAVALGNLSGAVLLYEALVAVLFGPHG